MQVISDTQDRAEIDVASETKAKWKALIKLPSLDSDDILEVTNGEGVDVAAFVEYLDQFYKGVLEEWARVCVTEVRSFIEQRLAKVPNADPILESPLGRLNTCDPDVAIALFYRRFKSQFQTTAPAHIRYALEAQIYFGCGEYVRAVEFAEGAWCHKQLPGFEKKFDQNDARAAAIFSTAEESVAEVLVPILQKWLKLGH